MVLFLQINVAVCKENAGKKELNGLYKSGNPVHLLVTKPFQCGLKELIQLDYFIHVFRGIFSDVLTLFGAIFNAEKSIQRLKSIIVKKILKDYQHF